MYIKQIKVGKIGFGEYGNEEAVLVYITKNQTEGTYKNLKQAESEVLSYGLNTAVFISTDLFNGFDLFKICVYEPHIFNLASKLRSKKIRTIAVSVGTPTMDTDQINKSFDYVFFIFRIFDIDPYSAYRDVTVNGMKAINNKEFGFPTNTGYIDTNVIQFVTDKKLLKEKIFLIPSATTAKQMHIVRNELLSILQMFKSTGIKFVQVANREDLEDGYASIKFPKV